MEEGTELDIRDELVVESLLLSDNELLLFKDEQGDWHVFSRQPYDKDKKYDIIKMTWEDLI